MENPKWTDIAIVVLTVGIVIPAHMQWREMHGAGRQTDDLIKAANIQADAASKNAAAVQSFAQSAGGINRETEAAVTQFQRLSDATKQAADAANRASKTATNSLVLGERPWIKLKHRIVQPLPFDVMRWKGPVASIIIEDTLENVGQSDALNVFEWEDVIPLDPNGRLQTAQARQAKWCDANRHRKAGGMSGYMLFQHDPFTQTSSIGPFMEAVNKAAEASLGDLRGKVGFVLVGCVVYRSSFEAPTSPAHETRFIYFLGEPQSGAVQPYVSLAGAADKLQLVEFPDGFSAE